jgi:type I restriction enzyme S subunit
MTKWERVTIADLASPHPHALATGPFGSAISAKNFVDTGVPVIRGSNLSLDVGVRLNDDGLAFLSEAKAAEFRRSVARRGDLIFTCWGTIGQVGLIDERSAYPEYIVSNKQMKLTPDPEKVESTFLYYLLSSPEMIRAVTSQATGAAVPGFNLGQLKDISVSIPSRETQVDIAGVLSTIDDLIENNRQQVRILEEMARAIYLEWFVHFRYPGHESIPLVDSALGPTPEGWEVGVLDDIVRLSKDTVDPATVDAETPAVGLEHIPRQQITLDSWGIAGDQGSRKGVFAKGDVLFGKIRPYFHKVSVAPVDGICSTDAIVLRPVVAHWGQAVFTLSSVDLVAHATSTSNGTKMPRADWKVLGRWPVVVPPAAIAQQFTQITHDHLDLAERLVFENARLASLRDLLLPKLVSGQIDVSGLDLDALVEAGAA